MSPARNSREAILKAAEAVVLEKGAIHMTLDRVAKAAGVSKGGLFYHFPTKEHLLSEMLEHRRKHIAEHWNDIVKGLKEGPGREVKAFILSRTQRDSQRDRLGSALLAAVAHDPKLLQSSRAELRRRLKDFMQSGLDFQSAGVIFYAVHGLVLTELLSISPLTPRERERLVKGLLRLAAK